MIAMILRRLLHAEPDALATLTHARRGAPAIPWFPIVNLVWLIWMVAAPWVFPVVSVRTVVLTYASVALFLWLYHRAWFGSRAQLPWFVAAIAALGLAIIPVNSSWSYVIYAGSLIPLATRGWRAVAWVAALLVAFAIVAWSTGFFGPLPIASCVVTTAVIAVLNGVYRQNGERDAELRLTQDEVRRLAVAAERERIGRDLHDLLGHTLSLVAVKSELARRLVARDPVAAERELADIEDVARNALAEVREAVTGMRMAALAAEVASARLMLEASDIALSVDGLETPLPATTEAALAYGLREAITNIQRHAHATRVDVHLGVRDGQATLTVRDNGRGAVAPRGNGLAGMEERLVGLGGRLALATDDRGLTVTMQVPQRTDDAPMSVVPCPETRDMVDKSTIVVDKSTISPLDGHPA